MGVFAAMFNAVGASGAVSEVPARQKLAKKGDFTGGK